VLRAYLLVYPALALYILAASLIFVPLTWVIGRIGPIYTAAVNGVRLAFWLSGVRVRTVNTHYARQYPTCVFASNHVSNMDPPALFMTLPRVAVVLKHSLRRIPLLGYVMAMGGFIYVDRRDPESRKRALAASVETLRQGVSMLIFPEGTRSRDGRLLPFRPGGFTMAIEAQVPVVPVTVHGTRELMPKGEARIRPGTVEVVFHAPIPTEGFTLAERGLLMRQVREVMEEALAPAANARVAAR